MNIFQRRLKSWNLTDTQNTMKTLANMKYVLIKLLKNMQIFRVLCFPCRSSKDLQVETHLESRNKYLKNLGVWFRKWIFLSHKYTPMSVGFLGGSAVKNLPAMQEILVQSLGQEDPLEKETATHSSILAWERCLYHIKYLYVFTI